MNSYSNPSPIRAVMFYVENPTEALKWYEKAFAGSQIITLKEFGFSYLLYQGIQIEIVQADAKVSSGQAGTVVYWNAESFTEHYEYLKSLGCTLFRGPMNIENNQKMCQLKDPFGNLIGLRGLN